MLSRAVIGLLVLVMLVLAAVGVLLLALAPDTPVPGLMVLGLALLGLWALWRGRSTSTRRDSSRLLEPSAFEMVERDRQNIDYDAQLRSRGEFDAKPSDSDPDTTNSL